MKKRIAVVATVLVISVALAACNRNSVENTLNKSLLVPETGTVIDITDKNERLVFVQAGDVLQLTLKGQSEPGFQWTVREPITGGFLSVKEHDVQDTQQSIISSWKFRVEKKGEFNIYFIFEHPIRSEEPEDTFRVKIISNGDAGELPNLLIDSPVSEEELIYPLLLDGYARIQDGGILYELKDNSGKSVLQGTIEISETGSDWIYFSRELLNQKPDFDRGFLEVGTIDSETKFTLPLKF